MKEVYSQNIMPIRLAIVGCGGIAAAHALAAQSLDEPCEIVALCDVELERAEEFRLKYAPRALVFNGITPLLDAAKPDAVIVCTTPATHIDLAAQCLNRGVAVLCEKPLAIEIGAARELVELSRNRGARLRTAAKFRFFEGVLEAKRGLQNGEFGPLNRVEIAFGGPISMANRWPSDAAQSGGGVLMDNGPHAVDLARFLLSEVRLKSVELRFGTDFAVEEEASLRLESESGVAVAIDLSWRRSWGQNFLQIRGERASLSVGWDETVWRREGCDAQILPLNYDKNRVFARQLSCFLDETSNPAPWRDDDGLRALEIIVAAYEMESRGEVLDVVAVPF